MLHVLFCGVGMSITLYHPLRRLTYPPTYPPTYLPTYLPVQENINRAHIEVVSFLSCISYISSCYIVYCCVCQYPFLPILTHESNKSLFSFT